MSDSIMRTAPNKDEIRSLIKDALKTGTLTKIANIRGVSVQAISKQFSENGDGTCHVYEALYQLWMICGADQPAFDEIWAYINDLIGLWKEGARAETADQAYVNISQEFADVMRAKLKGLPLHQQRAELLQLQAEVARAVTSLERDNVQHLKPHAK